MGQWGMETEVPESCPICHAPCPLGNFSTSLLPSPMNITLSGKRALVCGSTAGIGRATAIELATLGASVTLMARNVERLKAVAAELPKAPTGGQMHNWVAADFADPASVREAARTEVDPDRPFHILINNTGG